MSRSKREILTAVVPLLLDYADILDKRGDAKWAATARSLADDCRARLKPIMGRAEGRPHIRPVEASQAAKPREVGGSEPAQDGQGSTETGAGAASQASPDTRCSATVTLGLGDGTS